MPTKTLAVRAFLDTLPLPDNIGTAEYRALHELLSDLDSDDLDGNDLEIVEATLNEMQEWVTDTHRRLVAFREHRTAQRRLLRDFARSSKVED